MVSLRFRDQLAAEFLPGKDVKEESEAWRQCKVQLSHTNPVVAFEVKQKARAVVDENLRQARGKMKENVVTGGLIVFF